MNAEELGRIVDALERMAAAFERSDARSALQREDRKAHESSATGEDWMQLFRDVVQNQRKMQESIDENGALARETMQRWQSSVDAVRRRVAALEAGAEMAQ